VEKTGCFIPEKFIFKNYYVLVKMDYPPKGKIDYPPISLHSPSFSLQKEEKTKKKKSEKEEKKEEKEEKRKPFSSHFFSKKGREEGKR
jgi:hypothetical protein